MRSRFTDEVRSRMQEDLKVMPKSQVAKKYGISYSYLYNSGIAKSDGILRWHRAELFGNDEPMSPEDRSNWLKSMILKGY